MAKTSLRDGVINMHVCVEVTEILSELGIKIHQLLEQHEACLLGKPSAGSWCDPQKQTVNDEGKHASDPRTVFSVPATCNKEETRLALPGCPEPPAEPPELSWHGSDVQNANKQTNTLSSLTLSGHAESSPELHEGITTRSNNSGLSSSGSNDSPLTVVESSTCKLELRTLWTDETHRVKKEIKRCESRSFGSRLNEDTITSDPLSSKDSGMRAMTVAISCNEVCFSILHPAGQTRAFWNLATFALICIDMLTIPLLVFDVGDSIPFEIFAWLCTLFWTIDIFVAFRTGYFNDMKVEMRPIHIAKQYAKTWLPLDLFIVLFEWFSRFYSSVAPARLLRSTRALRSVRLVKLLRMAKMKDLVKEFGDRIRSNALYLMLQIFILTIILCICAHFVTCIWFALGQSTEDGWTSYDLYALREDSDQLGSSYWYVSSARWVISQLNGRTDMDERRNLRERFFTVVGGVLFAIVGQAIFISLITKSMLELSSLYKKQQERRRLVNEYLSMYPIPAVLEMSVKQTVREYKDIDAERHREGFVLALLPLHLQADILFEVRRPLLMNHPLLSTIMTDFIKIARRLCNVVKQVHAIRDETIFGKDDPCTRMLVIDRGALVYVSAAEDGFGRSNIRRAQSNFGDAALAEITVPRLTPGTCISEAALWIAWKNLGRLVTEGASCLLEVDVMQLAPCLQGHAETFALAVVYATYFLQSIKQLEGLSDILSIRVSHWTSQGVDGSTLHVGRVELE